MSLRARFVRALAKILRIPNSLTIVVINERAVEIDAVGEPLASGKSLEPGAQCTFRARDCGLNPEIHVYLGEGYLSVWDEGCDGDDLKLAYEAHAPHQSPAA